MTGIFEILQHFRSQDPSGFDRKFHLFQIQAPGQTNDRKEIFLHPLQLSLNY